jgi:tRNA pseudouridine55 synthase
LTDYEVGELNQERTVGPGKLLPPDWLMPAGFPDPEAPIRGIHLDKFRFLLAPADGQLRMVARM